MSGIDEAAAAFSADMGGPKPAARTVETATEASDLDITDVFGNHQHEDDVQAGGDEIPTDDEAAAEVEARKPAKDEEKDPLYDEEEDPDAEKGDGEDDDNEEDDEKDDKDDAEEVALDPDLEVTVIVDGKETQVPLSEALDGYIRTETFHQRLSEVNEVKKVLRDESGKLLEDRKQAIQMLTDLEEDLKGLMPDEPDWDKLFAEKPQEARGIQRQWEAYKGQLQTIRTKREGLRQEAQEREAKRIVEFAVEEREKFENMPENRHWATDPKKKEKDLASMVRTAKSLGFTDDEIRGTLDSRMLTILLRASKYDRMTANKPKLAPRGVKPAKPGAGNGPAVRTTRRGIGRAQQQLSRTGRVDDAAAVFAEIIKPRR
jgi:hypothetical protein